VGALVSDFMLMNDSFISFIGITRSRLKQASFVSIDERCLVGHPITNFGLRSASLHWLCTALIQAKDQPFIYAGTKSAKSRPANAAVRPLAGSNGEPIWPTIPGVSSGTN
jgi:hypothetical protein